MKQLIDKLYENKILESHEFKAILESEDIETSKYLFEKARAVHIQTYGPKVFVRGLIECTSYCKNDCYYCGIRKSNCKAQRYRLTKEQILECCESGYGLGFRTFVLQGGEDGSYTNEKIVDVISSIKEKYPDCAVTISLGEKSFEAYKEFFQAGADRYLLRHETANEDHYKKLHPHNMSLENRKKCLYNLKEIGYQVGCGLMAGSPYQTNDHLAQDLLFIKELNPHMVGIGPFIPHQETPFADKIAGTLEKTLLLLGIVRLMLPSVLLPSTTALGTINPRGRELGVLAGANVLMPNLSPKEVRKKYLLYDNKICTGDEAAESLHILKKQMKSIGYQIDVSPGDHKSFY